MTWQDDLRTDLEHDEGRRTKMYKCPAGRWTVGVGHNIEALGLPDAIIDALLDHDISMVTAQLDKAIPWWRTRTDGTQRAMVNMGFQMGVPTLLDFSKTLACLQAGDYEGAKKHARSSAWFDQTPQRAQRVTELFGT